MVPTVLSRAIRRLFSGSAIVEPRVSSAEQVAAALRDPKILVSLLVLSASLYVLTAPTTSSEMTSKRPDKTTTGFFNPSVDCFANSTVQSLSAVPALNVYFNAVANMALPPNATLPPMPLHAVLMHVMRRLQTPVYHSFCLSVWDVLHVVERIHKAKLNRIQHDAQELMQLIIETLECEYGLLSAIADPEDMPAFPFKSTIESKLRCMRCQMTSTSLRNPMNIISLNVPQQSTATLDSMLQSNQSEVIEGYSCLVCTLTYIYHTLDKPSNPSPYRLDLSSEEKKFLVDKLLPALEAKTLSINDDLADSPLYKSIRAKNEFLDEIGRSIVHRELSFVELPTILPIHLCRSIFADTQAMRNPCSVEFPNELQLTSASAVVKYRLKAVIRHQGSHNSGHYECYKAKPMFFKRKSDGSHYNDYPPMPKLIGAVETPVGTPAGTAVESPTETPSTEATPSLMDANEAGVLESSALNTSLSSGDDTTVEEEDIATQLGLSISPQSPSRLSEVVGRSRSISGTFDEIPKRSSVKSNSSSTSSRGLGSIRRRVSTIIGGKTNTLPMPVLVPSGETPPISLPSISKDKKLASVIKKPFWRISDGKVSECTIENVLTDGKAAYMLMYERVA